MIMKKMAMNFFVGKKDPQISWITQINKIHRFRGLHRLNHLIMIFNLCNLCNLWIPSASAEVSPYMGLWVGAAGMSAVNEVSIPLDADNIPRAPNPLVATPASGRADVRLILHVDPAGRARLLKDVAIINRNVSGDAAATAADIAAAGSDEFSIALVTDPALYAEYPMSRATRYTSVVFDFGDARATQVLDALVDKIVADAVALVKSKKDNEIATTLQRNTIGSQFVANGNWPVAADDTETSYQNFLNDVKAVVQQIAASPPVATTWAQTAENLRAASPFNDTRALELVAAIQTAGTANAYAGAWNAAADWADTSREVPRLLSSMTAGQALAAAAKYAADNPGATVTNLKDNVDAVKALVTAALLSKWAPNDTRATGAVDAMLAAVVASAATGHGAGKAESIIQAEAIMAGQNALWLAQAQYPAAGDGPGNDYTAFVNSADYKGAAAKAAKAAVDAALLARVENPLNYAGNITALAKAAAVNALQSVYAAAARARRNELPLSGVFAPGSGDARFTLELEGGENLKSAGLSGVLELPANFATNPFRHRRHPDHTRGFDITRKLRFDFDAEDAEGFAPSVTRGVTVLGGIFREEIFGLHKPLGPGKDIGLRTEGRFQLNRVSTIGSLNGN